MGAQFTSKSVTWSNDTETVLIQRLTPNSGGMSSTLSTIFNGTADFQSEGGNIYVNPLGVVEQADAMVFLEANTDGSLPAIDVGDKVTVNATVYNVVNVSSFKFQPAHVELLLKRGGLAYKK